MYSDFQFVAVRKRTSEFSSIAWCELELIGIPSSDKYVCIFVSWWMYSDFYLWLSGKEHVSSLLLHATD
jgi:hypothetical protein